MGRLEGIGPKADGPGVDPPAGGILICGLIGLGEALGACEGLVGPVMCEIV